MQCIDIQDRQRPHIGSRVRYCRVSTSSQGPWWAVVTGSLGRWGGVVIARGAADAGRREWVAAQAERIAAQATELAELKQRLGKDSSTSNRPPSSDSPYRKPERRSSRRSSGRDPGKQQGALGCAMPLVDNPNETIICEPDSCADCGADLRGARVIGTARRQITDVLAPPPPWVTAYRINP